MHPFGPSREALSLARFVAARGGREVALLPMLGPTDTLPRPPATTPAPPSPTDSPGCFLGPGGGALPPATAYVPAVHDLLARPVGALGVSLATEVRALRLVAALCAQQVLPLLLLIDDGLVFVSISSLYRRLFHLFVQLARHGTRAPAPTTAVIDGAVAHAQALVRGEVAVCRHWVRAAQAFAPALERAAALEEEGEGGAGDGSGAEALQALRDALTAAAPHAAFDVPGPGEEGKEDEGRGGGDDDPWQLLRACSDQALGEYCREALLPLLDRALHKKRTHAAGTNSSASLGGADEKGGARLSARCPRPLTPTGGVRLVRVRRGHRIRKVVVRRGVLQGWRHALG